VTGLGGFPGSADRCGGRSAFQEHGRAAGKIIRGARLPVRDACAFTPGPIHLDLTDLLW